MEGWDTTQCDGKVLAVPGLPSGEIPVMLVNPRSDAAATHAGVFGMSA